MQFGNNIIRAAKVILLAALCACGSGGDDNPSINGDNNPSINNDPAWGTAVAVSDGTLAQSPAIAMDGAGNAILVWSQHEGGIGNIYASRFNGMAWGTPVLIEANDGDAMLPRVAMNASGIAIAVWMQADGNYYQICSNRFDGIAWGAAVNIGGSGSESAYEPQIAMDSAGDAIAVWESQNFRVWTNRFNETVWGTQVELETNTSAHARFPHIAMDGAGHAIAVWRRNEDTRWNIYSRRFDGTGWGQSLLMDTDTYDAFEPKIAMDSDGSAIAVWVQSGGMHLNLWTKLFDGTVWDPATMIARSDFGDMGLNDVAMAFGNSAVVWEYYDNFSRTNIYGKALNGETWLLQTDHSNAHAPKVAVDQDSTIAVWVQSDGTKDSVYANRFDGVDWGTAQLIENQDIGYNASDAQIAMDGSGRAIAVWAQYDGNVTAIWANRFD